MNITQKEIIKSIDIFLPLIFSPSSLPLISLINNKTFFFFKYRQNACDTDGESSLLIKRIYEWWQEIHDVILHLIPFDLSRLTPIRQSFFFLILLSIDFPVSENYLPAFDSSTSDQQSNVRQIGSEQNHVTTVIFFNIFPFSSQS